MMLSKTVTAFVSGMEAMAITVETDVSQGFPSYHIVGQPDISIKESRDRIRLALGHVGCSYPKGRIVINMSPAVIKKRGSHFDLAIAAGILGATGQIDSRLLEGFAFLGEVSLDGTVNKTTGVLPMVSALKNAGCCKVFLPQDNQKEALLISGMQIYGLRNLSQLIDYFLGNEGLHPLTSRQNVVLDTECRWDKDYEDVHGQEAAKRAVMTAVAGGHGLLMIGSPATGKTMLAERIPSILPPLSKEEMLETTMIYSVAGLLDEQQPFINKRPFRQPHHKLTVAGLLGGGVYPKPGEIALAHKGVLFLDEVGEFDPRLMEAMRIPMETKKVALVRSSGCYTYPADFLLIGAGNPCPCGYHGDSQNTCKCSAGDILRYQRKFSGPMMDRIDMHIHLTPIQYEDLKKTGHMSSSEMRERIIGARQMQRNRYGKGDDRLNCQLTERDIEIFAPLQEDGEALLKEAYGPLRLNPRTLLKIRKLARTIADLEERETILQRDVAEALQYRGDVYGR